MFSPHSLLILFKSFNRFRHICSQNWILWLFLSRNEFETVSTHVSVRTRVCMCVCARTRVHVCNRVPVSVRARAHTNRLPCMCTRVAIFLWHHCSDSVTQYHDYHTNNFHLRAAQVQVLSADTLKKIPECVLPPSPDSADRWLCPFHLCLNMPWKNYSNF